MAKLPISLKQLPKPIKVTIFFFCIYCIFGQFISLGYHISKKGIGPQGVIKYYLGDPEEGIPPQSAVSFFEVMHFHTWAQASVIFILSIIFSLSSFSQKLKFLVIVVTFVASIGHIFLPSLVRFLEPKLVYILFVDTVILSAGMILMAGLSLKDLFLSKQS